MVPTTAPAAEGHAPTATITRITAARSARADTSAAGREQMSTADPLRLAGLLAQATQLALGAKIAQTALQDIFALVTGHGVGSWVGVSQRTPEDGALTTAASSEYVLIADHLQGDYNQGPGIDAAAGDETVTCADLAASSRWPQWARRVAALGAGALVSLPLHSGRRNLGALTIYRAEPHPYNHHDLQIAELIGAHVAIVLEHLVMCGNAWEAVDARHRIGKAQVVLMEQFHLTDEQAFALLRRYSQDSNRKIRDMAADIIVTRKLPADERPQP